MPRKPKVSKAEETEHATPSEPAADLVITLEIENAARLEFHDCVDSEKECAGGFPWVLYAEREKGDDYVEVLNLSVVCNQQSNSNMWSADARIRFKLLGNSTSRKPIVMQEEGTLNSQKFLDVDIVAWKDALDPAKGFIDQKGSLHVEAHIYVKRTTGVRKLPEYDFTAPTDLTDGVLVVDGKRLHVSKNYLSLISPVFKSMFYGNFEEQAQEEIMINDIVYDEFVELLHVAYPSFKSITENNVEPLLALADRFQIEIVTDQVEKFLKKDNNHFSETQKLVLADRFRLVDLQDQCLVKVKRMGDVKFLEQNTKDEWKLLSHTAKSAILDKLLYEHN